METPMDNQTTQTMDNSPTQTQETTSASETTTQETTGGGWKMSLGADLQQAPFMAKFDDSKDGLGKFVESYGNLEKLLGHEKVPIPKGDTDTEGWNRFAKAMGIPEKATEYGLPDVDLPGELKEMGTGVNKEKFAEIVHAHKLTPSQAKGLWKVYNDINVESYNKAMTEQQNKMNETINRLKGEWGDAYDSNVELGQMVINKFTDDKEMNDYVTAMMLQDPRGIKFLAKLGNQFAENKVGEFSAKRFSLAPEQAREEWQKIVKDPSHPYNNANATDRERQAAIDYVNSLIASANRGNG